MLLGRFYYLYFQSLCCRRVAADCSFILLTRESDINLLISFPKKVNQKKAINTQNHNSLFFLSLGKNCSCSPGVINGTLPLWRNSISLHLILFLLGSRHCNVQNDESVCLSLSSDFEPERTAYKLILLCQHETLSLDSNLKLQSLRSVFIIHSFVK